MTKDQIRVRIAPSPTGPLHLGTARAALYNYLFAKKNKGSFILRIEDTDLERSDKKYTKEILEGLSWLGLEWDEGPLLDGKEQGNYGPYLQSERTTIYKKYISKLIEKNLVYYCYCSTEELEKERKEQASRGEAPKYSGKCQSLTLPQKKKLVKAGRNCILRLKVPNKIIEFNDLIRGKVSFDLSLFGDFSIARDEKTPLYNLSAAIDDYTMQISHVIRGEDHISNTPKQIILQQLLGFPTPLYAHLPLILNEDHSKLSKRKNKVSLIDYQQEGYLPEALLNFLVLLGWNPKTKDEIFTKLEMIKKFSLENIHKGGAVFSKQRLDWINGFYLRKLKLTDFYNKAVPFLKKAGIDLSDKNYVKKAIALEQERIKKFQDLPEAVQFFFEEELKYDPKLLIWKKFSLQEIKANLQTVEQFFQDLSFKDFTIEIIEKKLKGIIDQKKLDTGAVLWPLRVALTGRKASPSPFEVAEVLGKKKVLERIKNAIEKL